MIFAGEDHPAVSALRARMDAFYAGTDSYSAFQKTSHYRDEWNYVREAIDVRRSAQRDCRVLEFGAGRTGFPEYLGEGRQTIHFTAHDVTPANEEFLRAQANEVCIGAISKLTGPFDVIFSTFVLEHVSDPRITLDTLFALLRPGGVMFLFCPRYDVPFYLSHSADHYGRPQRLRIALGLLLRRCRTILTGHPAFLIPSRPIALLLVLVDGPRRDPLGINI